VKFSRLALVAAVAAVASFQVAAQASTVYSASDAFESAYASPTTTGSAGQFSFGYAGTTVGSAVTPYTATTSAGTTHVLTWNPATSDLVPSVFHNSSASSASTFYTVYLEPNQLAFHPGSGNQYSVITFTAPSSGLYDVAAAFEGADNGNGTTTDVHVLQDGIVLDSGFVTGFHNPSGSVDFSGQYALAANQTLSFWVGVGANGNYGSDTTGIIGADLTITGPGEVTANAPTAVPLPASALSGGALLGLVTLARAARRRALAAD